MGGRQRVSKGIQVQAGCRAKNDKGKADDYFGAETMCLDLTARTKKRRQEGVQGGLTV